MTEIEYPPDVLKKLQRAQAVRNLLIGLLVVMGIVLLAAVGTGVYLIRSTQLNSHSTLTQVDSCVTPGQPCYQREQAQTAKVENAITSVQVVAAYCAVRPANDTPEKVLACVRRELPRLIQEGQ